ncbi:MAG TPA: tetratricopeptide repeat protein, partial [Tenuifilaceae bacterium]|nr:tetratricopeptide repeat protein [Tenuifilaceae bacterium]
MQKFGVFIILILIGFSSRPQNENIVGEYKRFSSFYVQGDLINAEKVLLNLLDRRDSISQEYLVASYNNLGVVYNRFGRYDKALEYINHAEKLLILNGVSEELADVYVNKSRIYGIVKEYAKAIDFLNQALKFYQSQPKPSKNIYYKISTGYLNLGLTYYEKGEFSSALRYLHQSCNLREKFILSEKALVYLNLAKVYVKLTDNVNAEKFFLKSIESFNSEFGPDYYRITSVLFDYGLFLRSTGRKQESLQVHQRALEVCLKNYGAKHPFVSLAYKLLGDYYTEEKEYPKALEFYQKALVAVVRDFNDTNIFSNPTVGSAIFSYRLLDNLKGKAQAFALLAEQQQNSAKRLEFLQGGYQTINLALEVIEKIRSEYLSVESKLYLAQNEKD